MLFRARLFLRGDHKRSNHQPTPPGVILSLSKDRLKSLGEAALVISNEVKISNSLSLPPFL